MDRRVFFESVRAQPFGGRLSQGQVDGLNAILDEWDKQPLLGPCLDPRHVAYSLATVFHETGRVMLPVTEGGRGLGRAYGRRDPQTGAFYYGRGQVQLTWRANYARMGARLNVDLVWHPELALVPAIGARILIIGMSEGMFTGKTLAQYFYRGVSDPINARRIVNGTDRAELVAGYYAPFLDAVQLAMGWTFA